MKRALQILLCAAGILVAIGAVPMTDAITAGRSLGAVGLACILVFFMRLSPVVALIVRLNSLSDRQRRKSAWIIFFCSAGYFLTSALVFQRAFHPTWHDDQMHAVQVRMLSTGHLWMQPHPMHEFFDTFHIFMTPVYAPIHFPGTAILNVAGAWLNLPTGVIPLLIASAGCVITFLLIFEVVDGASAFLAVACLWASPGFRILATMLTSHNAMLLLGVFSLWLFIRWQKDRSIKWAVALSVVCSLSLITRPVDALAYALPIGLGVVIEIFRTSPRRLFPLFLMFACAMPFLGLQLWFDKAVTGHWLTPPYKYYNDIFHPFTSFGGPRADVNAKPVHVSDLAQKQDYYVNFMLESAKEPLENGPWLDLWRQRLPLLLMVNLPNFLVYCFVPIGFLGLNSLRRWVICAPPILMLAMYMPGVYFFGHYPPVVIASTVCLAIIGFQYACRTMLQGRAALEPFIVITVAISAVAAMSPLSLVLGLEFTSSVYRAANFTYERIPSLVQKPALIFSRYHSGIDNFLDEPVYNSSTARIDDAKIVMAQWLGDHNIALIRYYHDIAQNRHVYVLDRSRLQLQDMGTVDEILNRPTPANTQNGMATTQP